MPSSFSPEDRPLAVESPGAAGRVFAFCASPRGAAIAALVFVVATAGAVALAATVATDTQSAASPGALGRVAQVLELHAPFRSWWYALALWTVLVVGLAQALRGFAELRAGDDVSPVRLRATFATSLEPDLVSGVLRRHGGRVSEDPLGALFVERGGWRRYAAFLRGAGCVGLALGIALYAFTSERGVAVVPEGDAAYGVDRTTRRGVLRVDLGAELQVERAPAAATKPWRLTLTRGAEVLARADLEMGEGVVALGTRYSLAGARPGESAGAFVVAVGGAQPKTVALGERFAGQDGAELAVVAFDPRASSLRVALLEKGEPTDVRLVFAGAADFDERVRRSESPLRFLGVERRAELAVVVVRAFAAWPIYLAVAILLLGFLAGAGRSVRLLAHPTLAGWILRAQASHDSRALAAELDVVLMELAGKRGDEPR